MTKGSNGIYSIKVPNVTAEAGAIYQVKVVQFIDGDPEKAVWHGNPDTGANIDFSLKSDCDVTVTYNPATNEIKVTGSGVTDPVYKVSYVTVVGEGFGNFLNDAVWKVDEESNRMQMVSADVYEITYKEVDTNVDLEFKFAANGTWVLNWGNIDPVVLDTPTDAYYDGGNIKLNYESDAACFDLTIRLDLTKWDADKKTGAKYTVSAKESEQPGTTEPTEAPTTKPVPTTVPATTKPVPTTVPVTTKPVPTTAPVTTKPVPTTVPVTTAPAPTVAPTTAPPATQPTTEDPCQHVPVVDKGYSATCTKDGLTDGTHCQICGKVLTPQTVIPARGHDTMDVKGYPATYDKEGLTDGKRCKRCGEWVVKQEVIPKLVRYGDVNKDGKVTIEDVTLLQKYIAELVKFDEDQLRAADTNGDGNIKIDDATEIQRFLAEIIDHLGG